MTTIQHWRCVELKPPVWGGPKRNVPTQAGVGGLFFLTYNSHLGHALLTLYLLSEFILKQCYCQRFTTLKRQFPPILWMQGVLPLTSTSGLPLGGGTLPHTLNAVSCGELSAARSAAPQLNAGRIERVTAGPPRNLLGFLLCLVPCLKMTWLR